MPVLLWTPFLPEPMKMNLHLISLGCPKNLVDSENIMGGLAGKDVTIVDEPRRADAIIINTCGFIEDAKKESIETIFSAVQLKKQGVCRYVLVTGCLSERYREELRAEIPEIDGIWGARGIEKLPGQIAEILHLSRRTSAGMKRIVTTKPAYAYLKIAEGCDNRCSFCIIPAIRGPHRSRVTADIVVEAGQLVQQGIRELILISQDTTYYGMDLSDDGHLLVDLLRELETIPDLQWLRLLYTYPERISDELIRQISGSKKICPYLDMPIQHISDDILRRMKRGSRRVKIERLIEKLRVKIPNLAMRTSLLVGFPGETDDQFEELAEFVQQTKFERLGVFQFSPEEGTEAAAMPNQIPEKVKRERFDALMEIQEDISLSLNRELIGKKLQILVDEVDGEDGAATGRTRWDAPEIDQTVRLDANPAPGDFVDAVIVAASEHDLVGELNR